MTSETTPSKFAFSVDVEDWYNCSRELFDESDSTSIAVPDASVIANTQKCMNLLDRNGSKATFFVLTTICEHYPELVSEIQERGFEVGVHTYAHRLLYTMTENEFRDDLDKSLELLRQCGVSDISGFRAPYWSITRESLWVLDILVEKGFIYDSSIFPIKRGMYGIPDAPVEPYRTRSGLLEVPPCTTKLFGQNVPIAGGGYLRLLPGPVLSYLTKSLFQKNKVGVFYCHPYELDPTDIAVPDSLTSIKSRGYLLQQKLGRKSNPVKLKNLIENYQFTDIKTLISNLDLTTIATSGSI